LSAPGPPAQITFFPHFASADALDGAEFEAAARWLAVSAGQRNATGMTPSTPTGSEAFAQRTVAPMSPTTINEWSVILERVANPEIHIRRAQPDDSPAIAQIWHLGWRDGHLGRVPAALAAARRAESFRTRAAQRVEDATVAVVGGEIAGFVMVVGDEVEQVYVSGDHRGSGVADVLLDEAERQIGDAGHATAWLAVVPGNMRARRFYQRRGWTDAGPFDYHPAGEHGPIRVPSHRYVKTLSSQAGPAQP
jgi:GNAT superfamily N-acetyltransferase